MDKDGQSSCSDVEGQQQSSQASKASNLLGQGERAALGREELISLQMVPEENQPEGSSISVECRQGHVPSMSGDDLMTGLRTVGTSRWQ
jgi:hypothetical protein